MKTQIKIMLALVLLLLASPIYAQDVSADACNFEDIKTMPQCLTEAEYKQYQYTAIEEPIGNTNSKSVKDYASPGTEIRQCIRIVKEIKSCKLPADKAPVKHTYQKLLSKDAKCQTEYNKDAQDRIFCEPVTLLLVDISESDGAGLLQLYIGLIYRWAAGIVGLIAVLIIILNAVIMITSQGEQGRIDSAKGRIIQSIGGLVILFLSSLILYAVNPTFFRPSKDVPSDKIQSDEQ